MTELEFHEYVEAVCKRPKLYTPTGTFFEVVSFLEGHGNGAMVGPKNRQYHMTFTPFRQWIVRKFQIEGLTIDCIDWHEFRDLFSSDEEAQRELPILYKEYAQGAEV